MSTGSERRDRHAAAFGRITARGRIERTSKPFANGATHRRAKALSQTRIATVIASVAAGNAEWEAAERMAEIAAGPAKSWTASSPMRRSERPATNDRPGPVADVPKDDDASGDPRAASFATDVGAVDREGATAWNRASRSARPMSIIRSGTPDISKPTSARSAPIGATLPDASFDPQKRSPVWRARTSSSQAVSIRSPSRGPTAPFQGRFRAWSEPDPSPSTQRPDMPSVYRLSSKAHP